MATRSSFFFGILMVGLGACAGEVSSASVGDDLGSSSSTTPSADTHSVSGDQTAITVLSHDAGAPVVTSQDASTPATTNKVERPSYNKGVGFFVRDGKLYDASGVEFRPRGVNKLHYDVASPGLANANVAVTRWNVDFTRDPAKNIAMLQAGSGSIGEGSVIIPGAWDGTCKDDTALLTKMVDNWVAQVDAWKQLEKYMILNVANEWGPGTGTTWRDAYIEAIGRLRAAGYHATISVTAPGCGQDPDAIAKYGQAVFDADPEKNVIFDQHIYGSYQDIEGGAMGSYDDMPDLGPHFADLAATGLVVMLGEFGPGRDIGPSPTRIDPLRVIELAEKHGLGWLAWAWDDNNLANGMSDDTWFSMSVSGSYQTSADLTEFGRSVVEHPTLGLKKLGKKASIFQ